MKRHIDKEQFPIATEFADLLCGSCEQVHLFFVGEEGEPLCEARITREQILELYTTYCIGAKQ